MFAWRCVISKTKQIELMFNNARLTMLLMLLLIIVLPGSIYGVGGVFDDEINTKPCKLSDGVLPVPENCTLFIRCQNGEPDVQFCPDGLLFNPVTLTCDFSESGKCSDSNDFDMTSAMVETDDIDCSEDDPRNISPIQNSCLEYYYICKNDTAFKVNCPAGLLMNADIQTCDYPKNVDCGCFSKFPTSATSLPFKLCSQNDFLPLPKCAEYLDCTDEVPKAFNCTNGLYFNPTTRVCDWPYNVECGKSAKPLQKQSYLFNCPCETCLIPSSTSCSHFYLCLGFTAYEMKCSDNLYFDRYKNTCNFAILVDCIDAFVSTTVEIESTEISTTVPTTEFSTSTANFSSTTEFSTSTTNFSSTTKFSTSATNFSSSTTELSSLTTTPKLFVCPTREGVFKHPGNCEMFYQCANSLSHIMQCAGTLHFSEVTKRCEKPCKAKCDLTLDCTRTSSASPVDPRCSCLNCKLPSPETCTKYIVCVNGRARIDKCPRGQTFDIKKSACDLADRVACHHSAMCPERDGLFPHKEDCHKFVYCSNGMPLVKDCPLRYEFDPIQKRCVWPSERCNHTSIEKDLDIFKKEEERRGFKCPKSFGYFPADQHCNKFYHCVSGTPALKECSEELSYNPKYQTCDWKKHVRCPSTSHQKPRRCREFDHRVHCSEDRLLRPHTRCNKYYDCTTGKACVKDCPVGLNFNDMTGVCDLPKNVKCLNLLAGQNDYTLKEFTMKCASGVDVRQVNPTNPACFYRCRQGKVVSGCCYERSVYNVLKDKCEHRTKIIRI